MTLCCDIDGVLASLVPDNDYTKAQPLTATIAIVNRLYDSDCHIVLFTARGSKTGIDWQDFTRQQMERFGVRYHELKFGKPAADWYIDDKMISLGQLEELSITLGKGAK